MPTIKSMIERFKETSEYEHKDIDIEKLLFGNEKYSNANQGGEAKCLKTTKEYYVPF